MDQHTSNVDKLWEENQALFRLLLRRNVGSVGGAISNEDAQDLLGVLYLRMHKWDIPTEAMPGMKAYICNTLIPLVAINHRRKVFRRWLLELPYHNLETMRGGNTSLDGTAIEHDMEAIFGIEQIDETSVYTEPILQWINENALELSMWLKGYTAKEIAKARCIAESSVKSRVHRQRRRVAREHYPEELAAVKELREEPEDSS